MSGRRTVKVTGVRRLDVTLSELGEIAWALDDYAILLEQTEEPEAIAQAARVRATRLRIARRSEFEGNPDAWDGNSDRPVTP